MSAHFGIEAAEASVDPLIGRESNSTASWLHDLIALGAINRCCVQACRYPAICIGCGIDDVPFAR